MYSFAFGQLIKKYSHLLLMLPALVLVVVIFTIPIVALVRISLHESTSSGIYEAGLTVDSYVRFLTSSWYRGLLWRTFRLALAATAISFVVGYPLAYKIWRATGTQKTVLLMAVMLPLFTNLIARLYGWQLLLARNGPINYALVQLGLIEEAALLNYNLGAVLIGVTYVALPYFILILMSTLEGVDWSLVEAAQGLGASRARSFMEVVLPLSIPGLVSAIAVAFAWGMGAYAEPLILGSPNEWTMGSESGKQIINMFDWPFGAAIAFLLVIAMLLVILAIEWLGRRWRHT
jgi:ABC-type spermidine/putrescine transport system permease subunit I